VRCDGGKGDGFVVLASTTTFTAVKTVKLVIDLWSL
jgi:hypothetical protein